MKKITYVVIMSIFATLLMLSMPVMSTVQAEQKTLDVVDEDKEKLDSAIVTYSCFAISNLRKNGKYYSAEYILCIRECKYHLIEETELDVLGSISFERSELRSPSAGTLDLFIEHGKLPFYPYLKVVMYVD
jgi:hypothetical protein